MHLHMFVAGCLLSWAISERHTGAELMYYGGTVMDLAVATVPMIQWWRASGKILAPFGSHT